MTKNNAGLHSEPWASTPWAKGDAYALKAVAEGIASEHQQKRAMGWIMHACGIRDLSFRPDNARATDFAEGKRFVGLQIAKLVHLPADVIEATDVANRPKGQR